jgi:hypothetical protein
VKLCAKRKVRSEEKRSDLKKRGQSEVRSEKRGKICKLCALIKVRIVEKF